MTILQMLINLRILIMFLIASFIISSTVVNYLERKEGK